MKAIILAAALLVTVTLPANAAPVEKGVVLAITTDDLECFADFLTSDSAYRTCRLSAVKKLHETVKTDNSCEDVSRWIYLRERLDAKKPDTNSEWALDIGNDKIEYSTEVGMQVFRFGTVTKPTAEKIAICDFSQWSVTKLNKELKALHTLIPAN